MKIEFPVPKNLIISEKKLLVQISGIFQNISADPADIELISDVMLRLDDLFMIVVIGEYNAGKSAFINALLGGNYLTIGVTPTTSEINVLRYGEDGDDHQFPVDLLKDLTIVDTPGTNAILRDHESLTKDFIPRSDLVFFVTSADRPFTESERKFLELVREWGKKIVLILNKSDIIETSKEIEEIKLFVRSNVSKLLGLQPELFTISAKKALLERIEDGEPSKDLLKIEQFISSTLNSNERIRLKLSNPLGVIEKLSKKYQAIIDSKINGLNIDLQLLEDINNQISLFKEDMLRSFKFRYAEIDNSLLQYEKRGLEFFDETFRLGRVLDLINKDRIQAEYKKKVVHSLNKEIDDKVNALIDWLVEEDLNQWLEITRKITMRAALFEDRIVPSGRKERVQFERQKIIDAVKRETLRLVERFNKDDEARKIAEDAQMAVAASAAIEAGALGLGTLVTILATSASADLTGILLAGFAATLGLFILPAKKAQARRLFSKNIQQLRTQLTKSLTSEFEKQIDYVNEKISSTIQPYSRFIRAEDERLKRLNKDLSDLKEQTEELRKMVDAI